MYKFSLCSTIAFASAQLLPQEWRIQRKFFQDSSHSATQPLVLYSRVQATHIHTPMLLDDSRSFYAPGTTLPGKVVLVTAKCKRAQSKIQIFASSKGCNKLSWIFKLKIINYVTCHWYLRVFYFLYTLINCWNFFSWNLYNTFLYQCWNHSKSTNPIEAS